MRATTVAVPPTLDVMVDGQVVPVPAADEWTIGRDQAADVCINDPRVSRQHATLRREVDGWWYEDFQSSNGSYHGDQLVTRFSIRDRVDLRLGNPVDGVQFSITLRAANQPTTTAVGPAPPTAPQAIVLLDQVDAPPVEAHATLRLPTEVGRRIPDDGSMAHDATELVVSAESSRDDEPTAEADAPGRTGGHPDGQPGGVFPTAPASAGGFLLGDDADEPIHAPSAAPVASPPAGLEAIDGVQLARVSGIGAILLAPLALLATRELPLPIFLLAGGLILTFVFGSASRLHREQVIDRWDMLISAGAGSMDTIVQATTARIDAQALPHVRYQTDEFAAGVIRGMLGSTRPFLVVSQVTRRRLRPYKMFVSVRDYGTNLQVSWFLAYHRSFFERLKPNPLIGIDLFDEQDLRAYVTAVHRAFLDAVLELMLSLGQDTERVDRNSKGFLGIS